MELRFKRKNILISSWLLENSHGNVIFCPGLPQYITKYHPTIKTFQALNFNVFLPRYYGTWESGGIFNIKNSVKTVSETVHLVKTGRGKELFGNQIVKWSKGPVILIGYSFGALPVLLNSIEPDINILICPFINYGFHNKRGPGEYLSQTLKFLERGYSNIYRFDYTQLIKGLSSLKYPIKKDFLLVLGRNDQSIPIGELDWLINKYKVNKNKIFKFTGGHSSDLPASTWKNIIFCTHKVKSN